MSGTWLAHLPALLVMMPLMAAPLCVLLRRPLLAWAVYQLTTGVGLLLSIALLLQVIEVGVVRYAIGGWAPPVGIEYRIDALNALVLVIVSGMAALLAPYARASVAREIDADRAYLFYALLLLCQCGLLGIAATGDAFNLFVFLEISSLSAYALIAMGRHRRALMAAFEYLIMGTIGGTFLLIGIGLMYMMTGTLNMADLAERLPAVMHTRTIEAALAFIVVGASLKLALVPLHAWLPDAYGEAPSVVSAFLAATATKVAVYVLARFLFTVFGIGFAFGTLPLGDILMLLSVAAMLYGAVAAIFADDLKRVLAWSSVGQIGYIVLGLSLATFDGLTASALHLFNHALIKGGLFAMAGLLMLQVGGTRMADLAGLARRLPGLFVLLLIGGLGLVGVPLTAGFVSKWALAQALIAEAQWLPLIAMLVSSLLALVYVGRMIEIAWFREPPEDAPAATPAPLAMTLTAWTLVAVSLWVAVDSGALLGLAQAAATAALGSTP